MHCGQSPVLGLFQGQSEALRKQEVAKSSVDKQKAKLQTVLLAGAHGNNTLIGNLKDASFPASLHVDLCYAAFPMKKTLLQALCG